MSKFSRYLAELATNPNASRVDYGPVQERVLSAEGLNTARAVIGAWPGYKPTPLIALHGLARAAGITRLYYKDEAHRFGLKSFKPLGGAFAVARMLMRELPEHTNQVEITIDDLLSGRFGKEISGFTVTAATDGNHGRSVAWGARMFGCRCVIFINEAVSKGRERAIASYGAEVRRNPGSYDDAVRKAQSTAEEENWFVIPDTSEDSFAQAPRDVTQGYAVMAAEAIEQLPFEDTPTHIFLQAGVGGMAAATCAQFWQAFGKDRPKTILVEPANAACWLASLKNGRPTVIDGDLDSLMGGLACGEVSGVAWEILSTGADATMAIKDEAAADCMRLLAEATHGDAVIVAGESGVAGLAGFLVAAGNDNIREKFKLDENSRVVVFGTEGATDPDTYADITGYRPEDLA
ncbi:MAG: diaminopropionate ammonia-lyase [Hyphomicrobiaceae bacterium]